MDHHGEEFVPPENRPMTAIVHSPTDKPQLIFEDENIKVESFLVDHFPVKQAIGFRIYFGEKVIIISGDTEITDNVFSLVDGADVLIHDGMIKEHVSFLADVAKENNVSRMEIAFTDILDAFSAAMLKLLLQISIQRVLLAACRTMMGMAKCFRKDSGVNSPISLISQPSASNT